MAEAIDPKPATSTPNNFVRAIEYLSTGLDETARTSFEKIEEGFGAFKKLVWRESSSTQLSPPSVDEEGIVFAKNNVLLKNSGKSPGYLFVRARETVPLGMVLILNWMPNAGFIDRTHASPYNAVSIDSSRMEEIRVFFSGSASPPDDVGHVIVRDLENAIHMFEFLCGGLSGLMKLLRECSYLKEGFQGPESCSPHVFTVSYPALSLPRLHPGQEEVRCLLTEERWRQLKQANGSLAEGTFVKNVVFFKGVSSCLRPEVWPYLLGVLDWRDCAEEIRVRQLSRSDTFEELQVRLLEETMVGKEDSPLMLNIAALEKDLVRADLSSKLFSDKEKTRETLRTLLLCYLVQSPGRAYSQGMTDLALPLLAVLGRSTADAFWCYDALLDSHALFMTAHAGATLEAQTTTLLQLLAHLLPTFHDYLVTVDGGPQLLFVHRWLLVNFRREFSIEDTLRIWETCWSCSASPCFHLLVCAAIVALYGRKPVLQSMSADELMIHFAGLAHSMVVEVVLSQARGLLYALQTAQPALPSHLDHILAPRPSSPASALHSLSGDSV